MALINCPECHKEISDNAVSCPNCGYLISNVRNIQEVVLKSEKRDYFGWSKGINIASVVTSPPCITVLWVFVLALFQWGEFLSLGAEFFIGAAVIFLICFVVEPGVFLFTGVIKFRNHSKKYAITWIVISILILLITSSIVYPKLIANLVSSYQENKLTDFDFLQSILIMNMFNLTWVLRIIAQILFLLNFNQVLLLKKQIIYSVMMFLLSVVLMTAIPFLIFHNAVL